MISLHYAARSDVGLVRSSNQDSGYAGPHLCVLCDGMGGPAGGDIASAVAVSHLAPLDNDTHGAEDLLALLRGAVADTHAELAALSAADPALSGLGTTCIAVMRSGNKLAMVHVGDSRAYQLRDGNLEQVTRDHTFVEYLVETGRLTREEASHHPQRSVLLRVLGDAQGDVMLDESIREAKVGDRWLLCSDGLSGVVSSDTIAEILTDVRDPGECAEELIRLALLAGGPDNVTCVVADIVPAGTVPPSAPQIVGAAAKDRLAPTRGGGGAAARAAALASPTKELPVDDEAEAEADAPRRPRFAWLLPVISLMLAIGVVIAGWLGWQWSQSQYYVMGKDGSVVIFQGIPQSIGSWNLSHAVEITDVKLDQLAAVDQQRLQEPVTRSSRGEVDAYVAILRSNARERALQQAREAQQAQQSQQNSDQQNQSQPTPTPEATQEGGN